MRIVLYLLFLLGLQLSKNASKNLKKEWEKHKKLYESNAK